MKKTETYMPRPGHTCRVKKPGDPWNRKQVAVTVVSRTGKAACALWSVLGPALNSPHWSAKRKRITYRDYMPADLEYVDLALQKAYAPKVGRSYVFVRDGHEWTGCPVAVLSVRKNGFEVARCSELCEWFMDQELDAKKPPSWTAKSNELC